MQFQQVLDLCGLQHINSEVMSNSERQKLWESIKPFAQPLIKKYKTHPLKFLKLTPKESQAIRNFRKEKKTNVVKGGNRTGKTVTGAIVSMAYLVGKDYFYGTDLWEDVKDMPIPTDRGRTIWAVGVDYPAGIKGVIWPKLKGVAPRDGMIHWRDYDKTIEYRDSRGNVSTLICKSADSGRTKFQGASVDLIWEDEEIPEDIHDECYQRTIDCAGHILITCTPIGEEGKIGSITWLYGLYEQFVAGAKDVVFTTFSIFDNPHLPKEEVDKAVEKWSGRPEGRARLYGDFYQALGLVYHELEPGVHFVPPFAIDRDWLHFRVIDPHPAKETACIWGAVDYFDNMIIYREYWERGIASDHAKTIQAISEEAGEHIDFTLIDPKGGNQRNAESHKTIAQLYRENGLYTRDGIADVDFRIAEVNEYLRATKDRNSRHASLRIFDNLPHLRYQISKYRQDVFTSGAKKGDPKGKPLEVEDDFCDCLGYACARRPKSRQASRPKPRPSYNSYT